MPSFNKVVRLLIGVVGYSEFGPVNQPHKFTFEPMNRREQALYRFGRCVYLVGCRRLGQRMMLVARRRTFQLMWAEIDALFGPPT